MALMLLGGLPDTLLVLKDPVNHLGVVVRDVQHLGGFVTGHAEVFDQEDKFQSILVRYRVVLALGDGEVVRVCLAGGVVRCPHNGGAHRLLLL